MILQDDFGEQDTVIFLSSSKLFHG